MIRKQWLAAPVLMAGLALSSACRRIEETRFVNFDAETSSGLLISGWSDFEKNGENDTFVWAEARVAAIAVTSRAEGDQQLRFRCWPFWFPGGGAQAATIFVNGNRVGSVLLLEGPRVYSLLTPGALWKTGGNEIRFEFAFAEAPKERIPGAGDARTLSAAFDWLEVIPSGKKSKR
jgi:hypothetical protein